MTIKEELNYLLSIKPINHITNNITIKNNDLLLKIKQETKFLDEYTPKISERIYCIINDIKELLICNHENCNNVTKYKKFGSGYQKFCCNRCAMTSIATRDKIEDVFMNKYGFKNPNSSENVKRKKINTFLDKYGVRNPSLVKEFQDKKVDTFLDKYGVRNPNQSEIVNKKKRETCLKKYGVEQYFSSNDKIEKSKQTFIDRYGVENYAQLENKIGYKWYKYVLPSGKEINIQGYEHRYLNEYFINNGLETDILIENKDIEKYVGRIWYITDDGKKHRYYPDCYLINENKIVEVKSTWTITKNININELKKQACLDKGLNFEFVIYDKR